MARLAYEVDLNIGILADVRTLVLCGAQRPTAFFAYPGKPSLPEAPGTAVLDLADIGMDIPGTLAALAAEIGTLPPLPADALQPLLRQGDTDASDAVPTLFRQVSGEVGWLRCVCWTWAARRADPRASAAGRG